jgi:RNA polymerase sigma factor (sigma-70 family)
MPQQPEADRSARDHLIKASRALVARVARGHLRRGLDWEELIAEGNLALAQAARRFDCAKGTSFATYASKRIDGAMRDALMRATVHPVAHSFDELAASEERDDKWDTPLLADFSLDPAQMIDPDDESGRPVHRSVRNCRPCQSPVVQARVVGSDIVEGKPLARDPYLTRRSSDFAQAKHALAALLAKRAS